MNSIKNIEDLLKKYRKLKKKCPNSYRISNIISILENRLEELKNGG